MKETFTFTLLMKYIEKRLIVFRASDRFETSRWVMMTFSDLMMKTLANFTGTYPSGISHSSVFSFTPASMLLYFYVLRE